MSESITLNIDNISMTFINNRGDLIFIISDSKEIKIPIKREFIKNEQIRNSNIKAFNGDENYGFTYYIGWDRLKSLSYDNFKEIISEIAVQIALCKWGDDTDKQLRYIVHMATFRILKK